MAGSSGILEPWMKRTLYDLKQRGLRAGDIFDPNNLPGTRRLLGKLVNFKPVIDWAEQGWVEILPGGQYRLTDAGFAAAS